MDKKAFIRSELAKGRTQQSVAMELGVSRQYVHYIARYIGADGPRRKSGTKPVRLHKLERQAARIVEKIDLERKLLMALRLVESGSTITRAAKDCRVSQQAVAKACKAYGVTSTRIRKQEAFEANRPLVASMLRDGLRPEEIAEKLRVTLSTAYKLAYEALTTNQGEFDETHHQGAILEPSSGDSKYPRGS